MDIPLNDFGKKQAQEMGKKLRNQNLNNPLLISSPLTRAMETAEIAGEAISHKKVSKEQAFIDLNFGEWQGKSKKEIEKMHPELYWKWLTEPATKVFPGGDSLRILAARAEDA